MYTLKIGFLAAALVATVGISAAVAQGRGGGHGGGAMAMSHPGSNSGGTLRGLNRADQVAGTHGAQGRRIARLKQSMHKRH